MDVIRCDEQEYLVHGNGHHQEAQTLPKKKMQFVMVVVYGLKTVNLLFLFTKQKDGSVQDYILGPYDQTIKTANFPILTSIVGSAFGGSSPFQAEIYFINLSGNVQIKFGIPYFDVFDPRFMDLGVPCAVRGTITFNITDYKNFIKLNRLINFDLDRFQKSNKRFFYSQSKISAILNIPARSKYSSNANGKKD
jgi:hypothetical protein